MNRKRCSLLLALLLASLLSAAGGCDRRPAHLADAAVSNDAAPDSAVVPDPLRHLERRGLFAQTPVENRFMDPSFALIDGVAWSPFSLSTYEVSQVTRLHQPSPAGLPVLRLEPPSGATTGQVMGMAKGAPGPMDISVWVGRLVGTNVSDLRLSLFGLFLGSGGGVDLEADQQAPLEIGGVSWVSYRAHLQDGPASWAYLFIVNESVAPLFVSAPVLVRAAAQTRRAGRGAPAVVRPLRPDERESWMAWQQRLRDRFGVPSGAPR